jgi:hypothetical protein
MKLLHLDETKVDKRKNTYKLEITTGLIFHGKEWYDHVVECYNSDSDKEMVELKTMLLLIDIMKNTV